MKPFFLPFRV